MPSECEKRGVKQSQAGVPPPEPEHLPCPRCESTNTKFCYYNNYNFSQPRHFCKACRRYWTHGGTLRDIPVGGGSRKNAKRSRISSPPTIISATNTVSAGVSPYDYRGAAPFLGSLGIDHGGAVPGFMVDGKGGVNMCGSFTSLLNTQGPSGLLGLGGFGLGMEQMGFGLGRGGWPFGGGSGGFGDGGGGGGGVVGNTWQVESGEGGFVGGDCFAMSDLAITTPCKGMK